MAVQQRMYNLTVDVAHTFFVGHGAWLVHNCGGIVETATDDAVSLFRAVNPDELADIQNTGAFRNLPGLEGKYFAQTEEQARQYGRMAESAFNDRPYTYVETSIPRRVTKPEWYVTVDFGVEAIVVPTQNLSNLSIPRIIP